MRASLSNTIAGSLAALAIGLGLASMVTPASAGFRGGFRGGFHGGWRGGYVGWRGGYGVRTYGWGGGYYGGCGYGAWRCNGYYGATPVVSYVPAPAPVVNYAPAPVVSYAPAPAPVAFVTAPAPAPVAAVSTPVCNVAYRPVFDADGTNVGTRAITICQ